MLIFLDTEFTNFTQPELISVGLVDEGGRTGYWENTTFNRSQASDFVKQVIFPQLGKTSTAQCAYPELTARLRAWLAPYRDSGAIIAYDYDGDWELLVHALGEQPAWLTPVNIWRQLNDLALETFWMESGLTDHHALHDALANRFAYRPPD